MAEDPHPGHPRGDVRSDRPTPPAGQVQRTTAQDDSVDPLRDSDEDIDFGKTGGDSSYDGSNSTLSPAAVGGERAKTASAPADAAPSSPPPPLGGALTSAPGSGDAADGGAVRGSASFLQGDPFGGTLASPGAARAGRDPPSLLQDGQQDAPTTPVGTGVEIGHTPAAAGDAAMRAGCGAGAGAMSATTLAGAEGAMPHTTVAGGAPPQTLPAAAPERP